MVLNCTCTIHTTRPTMVKSPPMTTVIKKRAIIIIHIEMGVIRDTEDIDFEFEELYKFFKKNKFLFITII